MFLKELIFPDNLVSINENFYYSPLNYIKYPDREGNIQPISSNVVEIPKNFKNNDSKSLLKSYIMGSTRDNFISSACTRIITYSSVLYKDYRALTKMSPHEIELLKRKKFTLYVDESFHLLDFKYILITNLIFTSQKLFKENFELLKNVIELKTITLDFDYIIYTDKDYEMLEHIKQFYDLKTNKVIEKRGTTNYSEENNVSLELIVEFNNEERKLVSEFDKMISNYPKELKEKYINKYNLIVDRFVSDMKNSKPTLNSETKLQLENNSIMSADIRFQVELNNLLLSNQISSLYLEIINSITNIDNKEYVFKYMKETMSLINSLDTNSQKEFKDELKEILLGFKESILEEINNLNNNLILETLENKIKRGILNFNSKIINYTTNNKTAISELLYIENLNDIQDYYGNIYRYLTKDNIELYNLIIKYKNKINGKKNTSYNGGIILEFKNELVKLINEYNIEEALQGKEIKNITHSIEVTKALVICEYKKEIKDASIDTETKNIILDEIEKIIKDNKLSLDEKINEITEIIYRAKMYENRLKEYNLRVKRKNN